MKRKIKSLHYKKKIAVDNNPSRSNTVRSKEQNALQQ